MPHLRAPWAVTSGRTVRSGTSQKNIKVFMQGNTPQNLIPAALNAISLLRPLPNATFHTLG